MQNTSSGTNKNKEGISSPLPKSRSRMRISTLLSLILIIAFGAGFAWSFSKYQETKQEVVRLSSLEGQREVQQNEVDRLIERVSQHIELPDNEQPTIATVSDAEALKADQSFFKKANNGDKVLIYVEKRQAILYSPERDIVVNVGTLLVNDQGTSTGADTDDEADEAEDQTSTGEVSAQVAGERTDTTNTDTEQEIAN